MRKLMTPARIPKSEPLSDGARAQEIDRDLHGLQGVRFSSVSHWFVERDVKVVLKDVSFEIPNGQFVAIVGASGSGKTTVLNLIAGLIRPAHGELEVHVEGERVALPSSKIGYMWARDALLPWRTLLRNVEIGLEIRHVPKRAREKTARDVIASVGLGGNEGAYPRQLSQGMRQRGNLARLLASNPKMFLMDEPFSALDAQTKYVLQREFSRIWESDPRTVVYVTHDLTEAALLADRVLVMREGRLSEDLEVPFARPRDLNELRFDEKFLGFTRDLWGLIGDFG
jgi:NitT/TauT family transport system ATP-binding protein